MFEKFLELYSVTAESENLEFLDSDKVDSMFRESLARLGGKTFSGGLYRVIPGQKVTDLTSWVVEAFPEYGEKVLCFGYDWLGRVFGVDVTRVNTILRFEHGFHEVIVIPSSIVDFHNIDLIESADAALSEPFYREWLATKEEGLTLGPGDCVGYEKSLFLGGEDVVENLEVTNLELYIALCHQIYAALQDLPEGTEVSGVTIE